MSYLKFLVPFLFAFTATSRVDIPDDITQKLANYIHNYPQEKIYIHFDREEYFANDDLFFKVYVVDGLTHKRGLLSYIAYVDFFDDKSNLILQKRIKISGGVGDGSFSLPDSIETNILTVKGYTSWMLNFDQDFLFEKQIKIFGNDTQTQTTINPSFDFQFLPESGYLIYGENNKLGFKATNNRGRGIEFSGKITEGTSVVATFSPAHAGMGVLDFKPDKEKLYQFEVTFPDGSQTTGKIENIRNDYVLQVDNSQVDFLNLKVLKSPEFLNSDESTWVAIQARGQIYFFAQVKLSREEVQIPVPKFTLPTGIIQCMLFNEDGQPKAERLAFINKPRENILDINISQEIYKPREETEVSISLKDSDGNPTSGDFSLTAFDLVQTDPEGEFHFNIRDYLMLKSELQGFIEDPGYYFDKRNPDGESNLDILLMTQGWRRFNWDKILNEKEEEPPYEHAVERGFSITGQLTNLRGKDKDDGTVTLLLYGDRMGFLNGPVNENGEFAFYDVDYSDSTQIFLQARDEKDRAKVKMILDTIATRPEIHITGKHDYYEKVESIEDFGMKREQIRKAFNLSGMDKVLEEVVIKGKRPNPAYERKEEQLYALPTKRFNLADYAGAEGYVNIFHFLRGRSPGINISGNFFDPSINLSRGGVEEQFILLIDGSVMPITFAATMPITRIETVDVVTDKWARTVYGKPIVVIYTKKDWTNENYIPQGTSNFTLAGYSINKEFYKPNYADSNNLAIPDYRATIHWEPYVRFDSLGHYSLNFYNSDLETDVLIKVEGITDSGEPISQTIQYEIRK